MAGINTYDNGVGGVSGSELATLAPIRSSVDIWYVHSDTGSDAAAPRGKERIRPLATLSQALTNAATDDLIVCLAGHQETLTAGLTFGIAIPGRQIIGEGVGSSRPKFTRNFNGTMFDIQADDIVFDNIYFPESGTASASARILTNGINRTIFRNCYIECGANDTGPAWQLAASSGSPRVIDTTFISTATSVAAQPASAIVAANAIGLFEMENVTIDGGATGWSNPYAINLSAGAITRLRAKQVHLLNDSDVILNASSTGYFITGTTSGSARVVW